jgi:hypothetical protein
MDVIQTIVDSVIRILLKYIYKISILESAVNNYLITCKVDTRKTINSTYSYMN